MLCQQDSGSIRNQYTASQFRSLPMHPSEIFALVRRVFHYVICFTWLMGLSCLCRFFLCFCLFALLGLSVAFRILPISLCSFRIYSFPDTTFGDSLACLALGPHRPSVSPVLCGLRLTRLTGLTCCKGICCVCGVWFLCVFCFVCGFLVRFCFRFLFCFLFPCLLACLSSFTDWCIAHKQQSREQKNSVVGSTLGLLGTASAGAQRTLCSSRASPAISCQGPSYQPHHVWLDSKASNND